MHYDKYRVFCKVIELGSLSKAAEALDYTQSGISRMIQSLERQMGFPLMIRNKGGIRLTEAGCRILPEIQAVVQAEKELQSAVMSMQKMETGALRIGVFPSVATEWLPAVLQGFQEKYPNIEIALIDGDYRELETWLLTGEIDLCFLSGRKNLKVNFLPLYEDEMMAVLPQNHPYVEKEVFPVQRFSEENFIFPARGMDDDVKAVMEQNHVRPNIKYRVYGDDIIIAMVKNQFGVGLLPQLYLKEHHGGNVIKPLWPRGYRQIGLGLPVFDSNRQVTDRFVAELKEYLKQLKR